MNICLGDHIRIRDVAVECLVKLFHIGVCHAQGTIDLRWRGDAHVPWELGRRGDNGEECQALQPWAIGTVQFEIDARYGTMRDDMVVEPADAMNRKGHDDVRFDAQYFIANRLLDRRPSATTSRISSTSSVSGRAPRRSFLRGIAGSSGKEGTSQRSRISSSSWNACRIGCMTACSSIASIQYRVCHRDGYSGVSSRSSPTSRSGVRHFSSTCSM